MDTANLSTRALVLLPLVPALAVALSGAALAEESRTVTGPTDRDSSLLSGANEELEWELDGRVYLDAAFYEDDKKNLANGTEIRRARVGFVGTYRDDWGMQLDLDFADDKVEIKDAWLDYRVNDWSRVQVGSFKEPFSQEELTSSRYLLFMERALPNEFAPGRSLGVAYSAWGRSWSGTAGLFGQEAGDVNDGEETSEGFGVTARLTGAPVHTGAFVVHLGTSGTYRTPDAEVSPEDDTFRLRTRAETHVDRTRFLNTGKIGDVHHLRSFGLEAAAAAGPVFVQGEFTRSFIERINGETDADFGGWYVQASYLLSGGARAYQADARNPGEFGPVDPGSRFGAWELAARHSTLRLNDFDAGILGGHSWNTTLGLNWYPNRHVRLMLNYVFVNHDHHADADGDVRGDDDFRVLQMRLMALF